ncbi:MAG: hypothetical protein RLW61_09670 [Gammaproteobacteria bacterium]
MHDPDAIYRRPAARLALLERLAPLGLARVLVGIRGAQGASVKRLRVASGTIELSPVAVLGATELPVIGRVGLPDPELGVALGGTLSFYGNWFDQIAALDRGYRLRRNIAALAPERLLEQIGRDDRYALVAEFSAAFRTILALKGRVPLVCVDDRCLAQMSFPVVLPAIADEGLAARLAGVLGIMLKTGAAAQGTAPVPRSVASGIDVEELDGDALR